MNKRQTENFSVSFLICYAATRSQVKIIFYISIHLNVVSNEINLNDIIPTKHHHHRWWMPMESVGFENEQHKNIKCKEIIQEWIKINGINKFKWKYIIWKTKCKIIFDVGGFCCQCLFFCKCSLEWKRIQYSASNVHQNLQSNKCVVLWK